MKRIVFVVFCTLILSVSALGQYERISPQLPEIGPALARLDKATGWMQMPDGEWIEREHRIPKYLSSDYYSLLDYKEHGLGIDNFYWIELREVEIKGEEYYLLLKARRGGQYLYPRIKKDWNDNYQIKGYVINREDWKVEFND